MKRKSPVAPWANMKSHLAIPEAASGSSTRWTKSLSWPTSRLLERPGQRLGDAVADEAEAWEADLIVVGTHGRHGVGRVLLGSGAEQIIRAGRVPVLSVRGSNNPAPA